MRKLRFMIVTLGALALVYLYSCKGNKGDESSESDTLPVPAEYDDAVTGDEYPAVDSSVQSEPVMTEDKQGNLSPETTETTKVGDVFYIVAGSFTVYSNAQQLNQQLKTKGFDSNILEPFGNYNRVTVKQFATREDARAALPGLRSQVKDQTLWILKR